MFYVGKPHSLVYEAAMARLAEEMGAAVDKTRVCAIGDSMLHDIQVIVSTCHTVAHDPFIKSQLARRN